MTTFFEAKDLEGNVWPHWTVEEYVYEKGIELINTFNLVFQGKTILYPNYNYEDIGFPLPLDTKVYMIHNERFKLKFTELTARKGRRCTNEYCQIALAHHEANGYPALVGQGLGRVTHAVAPDFNNPSKLAIYRMDVPMKLARAATNFDDHDKPEPFELLWDSDSEYLYSTVPSRGRRFRGKTAGTGSASGWSHGEGSPLGGPGGSPIGYVRPTLRQLIQRHY